jgi:hypothetical protein
MEQQLPLNLLPDTDSIKNQRVVFHIGEFQKYRPILHLPTVSRGP